MPNRFTRVPDAPAPPLPLLGRAALPVADLFMLAMVSRPAPGSLRNTWVTPATLWLCVVVAVGGVAVGAGALAGGWLGAGWTRPLAAALAFAVALGSGAVALVGLLQRSAD